MNDRLAAEIERVRSDKSIRTLDEANVKQGVILPILNALGWNPFNTNEVRPEYPVQGGNVDYSLRLHGANKVFLEAKRPSEDLSKHQVQLLNYSFAEGVPLAILTNGLTWWFYLPLREGSWEERRFGVIDLRNQDVSQTADSLIDFLSMENVRSGTAVENAESHLAKLWKARRIEETLPRAWKQFIADPADLFVELLNEKVKELCGWEADLDQIKHFLSDSMNPTPAQFFPTPPLTPPQPRMQGLGAQHPHAGKKPSPVSFSFCGEKFGIKTWSELLTNLAEVVYKLHPSEFDKVSTLGGWYREGQPFPKNPPKPISDSGWYVYTAIDRNQIRDKCHKLLAKFGYSQEDLVIETA